jgi:hypothetical protein
MLESPSAHDAVLVVENWTWRGGRWFPNRFVANGFTTSANRLRKGLRNNLAAA